MYAYCVTLRGLRSNVSSRTRLIVGYVNIPMEGLRFEFWLLVRYSENRFGEADVTENGRNEL